MLTPAPHLLRFGVFELDTDSGELRRHGMKIRLPDQAFHILKTLLDRPGEVVTRDELRRVLWTSDTFVDFEVGLNSAVRKLREALDDAADNPRFVETLPRRGYRFVAPVTAPEALRSMSDPAEQASDAASGALGEPAAATALEPPAAVPPRFRAAATVAGGVLVLTLAAATSVVYQREGLTSLRPGAAVAAGQPRRGGAHTQRVINPKAYDAYVKGLTARGLQRHEGFRRAVAYFEEAVAIQPDFAEAYAALALVQTQFLFGGPFSPHEAIPKAEAAARQALELDATLAQAHWALGQILGLYHWRWQDSAEALQRAVELQGGRDEVTAAVSESLIRNGQFGEALAMAERGRRLDPYSLNAQVAVGTAYRAVGQHDRAVSELRRALAMSPGNTRVQFQLGVTFVAMDRLDDAIRELEAAARPAQGHSSRIEAYLGYAYAAAGRTHDAREMLKELESHRREQYVSSFGIALIHDALGEKEPAVAALQRAFADRAVEFAQMAQYPPFKTMASEPRYQEVTRQVGLPRQPEVSRSGPSGDPLRGQSR
jgi:DNA-binding winged helix-turn-helix (wHTH) protein/Tfp pilus assembly protein PilF